MYGVRSAQSTRILLFKEKLQTLEDSQKSAKEIANEMELELIDNSEWNRIQPMLHSSELTNSIERCVTKRGTDYLTPRANRLARLSKFYISGPIMTYYQFKH